MERLTKTAGDYIVFPAELVGVELTPDNSIVYALLKRLAAYEDTGLMPEEVRSLWGEWRAMLSALNSIGSYDRLRELTEADKDGRVVVLPCKVGDTVFLLVETGDCRRVCVECNIEFVNIGSPGATIVCDDVNTHWQYGATAESFGKTVFLTREAAEAALKEGRP